MKIGILGTGMIVKDLMKTYKNIEIEKTFVLGTKETEEEVSQIVNDNCFDGYVLDYDELLEKDIDTVYVALPNFLHYSFAKKALEHGKNVIIEKPITANVDELKELVKIAREKDLVILEAMNIHHLPAYINLKNNLNKIGNPRIVIFNYSQYSSRYDSFKKGEILPVFDPKKAGGSLMDLNVYNIHAIVGLFGKPKGVIYKANIEKGIDTSGVLMLDYGNFKAVSIGAKDCKAPVVSTIQGDLGYFRLNIPVNQLNGYEFALNKGEIEIYEVEKEHRLLYEFKEFKRIIEKHDTDKMNQLLEVSLNVSEIMTKARKQEGIIFENDKQ